MKKLLEVVKFNVVKLSRRSFETKRILIFIPALVANFNNFSSEINLFHKIKSFLLTIYICNLIYYPTNLIEHQKTNVFTKDAEQTKQLNAMMNCEKKKENACSEQKQLSFYIDCLRKRLFVSYGKNTRIQRG